MSKQVLYALNTMIICVIFHMFCIFSCLFILPLREMFRMLLKIIILTYTGIVSGELSICLHSFCYRLVQICIEICYVEEFWTRISSRTPVSANMYQFDIEIS